METWPLGVFASIDAGLGVRLEVAHALGVKTIHLHTPQQESRTEGQAREFLAQLQDSGMTITCVFGGFEGESYADIPTVKKTVGLVPVATRNARLAEMKEIADFARRLAVNVVGLHIGFVPHDRDDADYRAIVALAQDLCAHAIAQDQAIHLETGQEPADILLQFLDDVDRGNLFINFDPANMILYGVGEPIEALEKLGPRVRSVHCKDATWSDEPGMSWGTEVPLGEGAVGMETYLRTLQKIGYSGPLTIEREIPQEPARQKTEIAAALDLLQSLKTKIET
jgi:sugar phosphate isomerase/epimerase